MSQAAGWTVVVVFALGMAGVVVATLRMAGLMVERTVRQALAPLHALRQQRHSQL